MGKTKKAIAACVLFAAALSAIAKQEIDVAAYIWPAYQNEPRWAELGIFKDGCGEWQNVYQARPKKPWHNQPVEPLWGYGRDDDPVEMSRQIDAALAAGINVFIYDWYWYGGRPFLENALNNGFLKAPNNSRMKFYLMWANHDVNGLWDNTIGAEKKGKVIWNADVGLAEFKEKLVPRFIGYFKKPNYYKVGNRPVLGIYEPRNLARGMGGWANVKEAFDFLRAESKKAGFAGVYLMLNSPARISSFKDTALPGKANATVADIVGYLGFDGFTTYNWATEYWSELVKRERFPYSEWVDMCASGYDSNQQKLTKIQYFPHVSTGWDTNPRYPQDQYQPSVVDSNPRDFERALRIAKKWIASNRHSGQPKLITLNAWNEWTEGCYLMPDKRHGYGFLNACARVFKRDCPKGSKGEK